MEDFQEGDTVRLKSQIEPWMTVNAIFEKDFGHSKVLVVECVWISGNKKYVETFKPILLTKD